MLTMARIDRPRNKRTSIYLRSKSKKRKHTVLSIVHVEIDRRYDKANFALRLRDYRISGQSVLPRILVESTDVKYETNFPA